MILHRIMKAVQRMQTEDSNEVRQAKQELEELIATLAKNEPMQIEVTNDDDEQGNTDIQL